MELQQVRYFLATCDTLNFTRAAESCNVTQPALTKALKLLENELGGELFDRQSRPMSLTDLGRHLLGKFQSIHELKTDIAAQAKLFNNLDRTVHTLGIVSTIGNTPFLRIVESLQRKVPGIALSLCLVPQQELVRRLREGALELAIIVDFPPALERLDMSTLYEERYVMAIPPEHPLAKKKNILLEDLNDIDYIHRIHCELNAHVGHITNSAHIKLRNRLTTDQDAIAKQMIQSGLGVSLMPKSLCTGLALTRDVPDLPLERKIALAHLSDRKLSPSAAMIKTTILKQTKARHARS